MKRNVRQSVGTNATNNVEFSLDNGPFTTINFFNNLSNGSHTIIATDEFGCQSVPFVFEVAGSAEFILKNIKEEVCFGESIDIMGEKNSIAGIYLDTIPSDGLCDTLVKIDLKVRQLITNKIDVDVCFGDSIKIGNKTYDISGTGQQTLTSINGCDNILNISVRMLEEKESEVEAEICTGEFVKIGQENYGTDSTSESGCDSTLPIRISIKDEELCENGVCGRYFIPNVFTPNGDQINDYFLKSKEKMLLLIRCTHLIDGAESFSLQMI